MAERARCAGLLGAAVRDLGPVNYRPNNPRYQQTLDDVLGIFDPVRSQGVPIADAIAAADALGQAGDPRFAVRPRSRVWPRRDSESSDEPHFTEMEPDALWVRIPAGEFQMGAQKTDPHGPNYDPEAYDEESPVHRVSLAGYQIARYPVIVDQFRLFVENDGYENHELWVAGGFGQFTEPDGWEGQLEHPTWPVTGVSWFEAQAFCRWTGCRLPSEAEWERAARGGDARKYPWGNEEPDETRMNYNCNVKHPTPVGIYPRGASPDGLADMAGNVWEWCEDAYGPYAAGRGKKSKKATEEVRRVLRGGGWHNPAGYRRVSYRLGDAPFNRYDYIGFRVVHVLVVCGQDS